MNTKPIIIWEKWKDPLGFEDQEETNLDHVDQNSYDEEDLEEEPVKSKRLKCHIINTPFGMIPINENTASTNIFNFWSGHTNFAITQTISDIIESTDGVETLNVFTKYRFRIAVGKAFNDSLVLRNINNNIYGYIE